jgi:MerR family mercuric resistance operon transcriptional regulator
MERLTAGQLAKKADVNVETIRYYERRHILPRPTRTRTGYRIYPEETVQRIRFVKRAQELGFSLKEVKELLGLRAVQGTTAGEIRKRAEAKISDIERKIQDLKAMQRNLTKLMNACPGCGPLSECPILEGLEHDNVSN